MGATREQIIAAYGQPDKKDSNVQSKYLTYSNLRTNFMLMQNRLVNMTIYESYFYEMITQQQ